MSLYIIDGPGSQKYTNSKIVTKLQFMNKFSQTALESIYSAAKVNIAAEIWLEKFKLATEIDLNDQQTIKGLEALKTAGLITEEEKQFILN